MTSIFALPFRPSTRKHYNEWLLVTVTTPNFLRNRNEDMELLFLG